MYRNQFLQLDISIYMTNDIISSFLGRHYLLKYFFKYFFQHYICGATILPRPFCIFKYISTHNTIWLINLKIQVEASPGIHIPLLRKTKGYGVKFSLTLSPDFHLDHQFATKYLKILEFLLMITLNLQSTQVKRLVTVITTAFIIKIFLLRLFFLLIKHLTIRTNGYNPNKAGNSKFQT